MIYIITALKPEAQAFVDFYKLKKLKLYDRVIFVGDGVKLIISGLGVVNSREATQALINHFDVTDDDVYLNVGICAAHEKYKLGSVLEIGSVTYEDLTYVFEKEKKTIVCLDEEAHTGVHQIVDMESFGFYDAVVHSLAIKKFHILKVVSDHFEPSTITKDNTKSFIFNVINDINFLIKTKD